MKNKTPYFETKLGKLYKIDCLKYMSVLPSGSIDLIIADPPYGIEKESWDSFKSHSEFLRWTKEWIKEASRLLTNIGTMYVFGFPEKLADVKYLTNGYFEDCKWLVWYYRNKPSMANDWGRSHESILHLRKSKKKKVFNIDDIRSPYQSHTLRYPDHPQAKTSMIGNGKGYTWKPNEIGAKPRDVLEIPAINNGMKEKTAHPTQKPEELIKKLLMASSNEGALVFDPFGGSGTTYKVSEELDRRWLGCETHEPYCRIIRDRLEAFIGQGKQLTIQSTFAEEKLAIDFPVQTSTNLS